MPRSGPLFPKALFELSSPPLVLLLFKYLQPNTRKTRMLSSPHSLKPSSASRRPKRAFQRASPQKCFPPPPHSFCLAPSFLSWCPLLQATLLPSYSLVSKHGLPNHSPGCCTPHADGLLLSARGPLPLQSATFQIPFTSVEF